MKVAQKSLLAGVLLSMSSIALAAGQLNLYNWGNYTNPKLIEKFEKRNRNQSHHHRL